MYETFEHTADVGVRIHADSLEQLFEESAEALVSVLVVQPEQVQTIESRQVGLEAGSLEDLLHDWLSELLVLFALEKLLGRRFEVRLDRQELHGGGPGGNWSSGMGAAVRLERWALEATVWGERLDLTRHQVGPEIKAVTYHGLRVEKLPSGWVAEVILDL